MWKPAIDWNLARYLGKNYCVQNEKKMDVERSTLKYYYDEITIFPIWAILKHKQVVYTRRKMLCNIFRDNQVFKICKLANGAFPLWDVPAGNHGSCIYQ